VFAENLIVCFHPGVFSQPFLPNHKIP
jgi:hypothetical protein